MGTYFLPGLCAVCASWSVMQVLDNPMIQFCWKSEVTWSDIRVWWPILRMFALHLIPSKCTHTVNTHPEQWAANAAAPGDQLGVRCLAQGSHLSRGIGGGESTGYLLHWQFLQEMRLSTSPYIRPRLPRTTLWTHTRRVMLKLTTFRLWDWHAA